MCSLKGKYSTIFVLLINIGGEEAPNLVITKENLEKDEEKEDGNYNYYDHDDNYDRNDNHDDGLEKHFK